MKVSTTTWTLSQNGGKSPKQFVVTLRPVKGAPSAKGKKKAPPAPAKKKAPPAPAKKKAPPAPAKKAPPAPVKKAPPALFWSRFKKKASRKKPAPKKPPAPKSKKEDEYDSDDSFIASEDEDEAEVLGAVREARRVAGEFGAGGSAARKARIAAASAPTVSFGFSKPTSSAAPTILVPRRKK